MALNMTSLYPSLNAYPKKLLGEYECIELSVECVDDTVVFVEIGKYNGLDLNIKKIKYINTQS